MNKHDWVFVGVRLLGVFFLVQVALEIPRALGALFDWNLGFWSIIGLATRAAAAWILAVRTEGFCAWLGTPEEQG